MTGQRFGVQAVVDTHITEDSSDNLLRMGVFEADTRHITASYFFSHAVHRNLPPTRPTILRLLSALCSFTQNQPEEGQGEQTRPNLYNRQSGIPPCSGELPIWRLTLQMLHDHRVDIGQDRPAGSPFQGAQWLAPPHCTSGVLGDQHLPNQPSLSGLPGMVQRGTPETTCSGVNSTVSCTSSYHRVSRSIYPNRQSSLRATFRCIIRTASRIGTGATSRHEQPGR